MENAHTINSGCGDDSVPISENALDRLGDGMVLLSAQECINALALSNLPFSASKDAHANETGIQEEIPMTALAYLK